MNETTYGSVPQPSEKVTLIIVSIVQFLVPFLLSAIGIALPSIGRDLHASAVQLSLIQMAQMLGIVSLLLPIGRFADIHGRKRIYITGIFIVCITTFALAIITSIKVFILFRFLQGLGASMVFSTSTAILTAVVPPNRRGRAMGIMAGSVYAGMAAGPSLSGFIIEYAGWRWVFGIGFMVEMVALVLTLAKLKGEWTSAKGEPFDWIGTIIFMPSMMLLVYGASRLAQDNQAVWIALTGLTGLGLFLRHQWHAAYPILDVRLLIDNLAFTFSNLAAFINYAATFSYIFFFSLYLQYVKGLPPKYAGLLIVIQPVVQTVLAPISGRLSDVYPPEYIATMGMGFCTVALFLAGSIDSATSITLIVIVTALMGFSLGLFSTPNMTAIMGCVEPHHIGTASSMIATMRGTGMLASATIIAVILSFFLGTRPVSGETIDGFMKSMHTAMYVFSAMSLFGALFSMIKGRLATSLQSPQGGNMGP